MKLAIFVTLCVASSHGQWPYPYLYSAPATSSPLMTGTFVSKAVYPNAKLMAKTYNGVWGVEGEEAEVGLYQGCCQEMMI